MVRFIGEGHIIGDGLNCGSFYWAFMGSLINVRVGQMLDR